MQQHATKQAVTLHPHDTTARAPAQIFSQESLDFQERIFTRNGLSEATYCPPSLHAKPPIATMDSAREEARMVLFGAVSEVLQRTGGRLTD